MVNISGGMMRCDQLLTVSAIMLYIMTLFGCTGTEEKIGSMTFVDSVCVTDDIDHCMRGCTSLKVYKDEVFAIDMERINVYDLYDLSFKRTFGKTGKGPGEFNAANDFEVKDDTIYVCDGLNCRLQLLNLEGEYIKSLKMRAPFLIETWNNKIHVMNLNRLPDYTIWEYDSGKITEKYKVGEIKEKSGFSRNNVEEMETYGILFNDDLLFIRFHFPDKFHILNSEGLFEEHKLSQDLLNLGINDMSNVLVQNDKMYLAASKLRRELIDKDVLYTSSRQIKNAGISEEFLIIVNSDYEIEKRYKFPVNSFTYIDTLVVIGEYVLVYDSGEETIYKYRLDS